MASPSFVLFLAAALAAIGVPVAVSAQSAGVGTVTKREIPRFVSLRKESVNLREGPSDKHATRFVYQRLGLPVEIVGEFENWRRIRDSEGAEGWVWHSLLSGKRTGMVVNKVKVDTVPLHAAASGESGLMARLEIGVVGQVKLCDGQWCRFIGKGFDGWVRQEQLWGVYPEEKVKD